MEIDSEKVFNNLMLALPDVRHLHMHHSNLYEFMSEVIKKEIENNFSSDANGCEFGPFGKLELPFHSMGTINSLDLFGMDELIIFSFYWKNRGVYKKVSDIGANIGLHTILMQKSGFRVTSYEPDPVHFELLQKNTSLNDCNNVELVNAAISSKNCEMEFVRVLGNTTGSHLAGSKSSPYGELDRFMVEVKAVSDIFNGSDFIKIDAEGHENEILLSTNSRHWSTCDAMVEVGSQKNAEAIFSHMSEIGVKMYAQKIGWDQVVTVDDLPISYKEGSLFISNKLEMPW